jgi:hypothetical protein
MNKKILIFLSVLTLITPATANAAIKNKSTEPFTLAILDTSIDSSLPIFRNKIIQEVCILESNTCPNNTSFMEGPGSASMTELMINNEAFKHGTAMASTAIKTNSNINIVFIRIIGQSPDGSRQYTSGKSIVDALFWVFDNKDKYNIKAVSMSQGSHDFKSFGTNYCDEETGVEIAIKLLLDYDIPSFFPAGNEKDKYRINWPACIKESISVGSATKRGLASYTNSDSNRLDFYTEGSIIATMPGGIEKSIIGTSISTQIAAARWLDLKMYNPGLNSKDIYNLFYKTAIKVKNGSTYVRLINLKGAING